LRDAVRDRLRDAILDGTLEPGERLSDDALIGWLGVSRTPIREALGELTRAGLIEMSANRYTRVATPDPAETLDALKALGALMAAAVAQTIPSLSDENRDMIAAMLTSQLEDVRAGRVSELGFSAPEAYRMWVSLCPNPLLRDAILPAIDGLAFRLRTSELADLVTFERVEPLFLKLRRGILDADLRETTNAIRAIHHIPEV
jgi:DNA-binding GntR family transcriptional regulator